jgi:ribosomal peptide maturation radical SAM protein 1
MTMPFGPMTRPSIGISLLKAGLARRGISCDLRYFNLDYASLVGHETYRELSEDIPTSSLFGDWLFRDALFEPDPAGEREYLARLPTDFPGVLDGARLSLYLECRELSDPFLDVCIRAVDWDRYALVGFTTTFQQTVPSLALARRIKELHPHVAIAFGGANCEGEMGRELHRRFEFVDFVFSGESDATFPVLAAAIRDDPEAEAPLLAGVTSRWGGRSPSTSESRFIEDLDQLPYPDYSDFVASLAANGLDDKFNVQFLIETSRGCWWGEKHHCTFCGLNGQSMRFRSKNPERVIAELRHLVDEYDARVIWGTDNIIDHRYYRTVLPELKRLGLKVSLFFETKANIRKDQLRLMREVGLNWFQPGIESLNTHQLKLMEKGCTGLQNIQLLKWVRQYGMAVTWNMLMGFPGETADDYERLARYCEAIPHLQPPSGAHPIRLDRFSPYFDDPDAHGITAVRPYPSYGYVYPFSEKSLRRLAYFFVFDYSDGYDPLAAGRPLLRAVHHWVQRDSVAVLYAVPGESVLLICDTRPGAASDRVLLTGWKREAYLHCDAVSSAASVIAHCRELFPDADPGDVRAFLDEMVDARLMLEEDDRYLSLAVLVDDESDLRRILDQRLKPDLEPAPEVAAI